MPSQGEIHCTEQVRALLIIHLFNTHVSPMSMRRILLTGLFTLIALGLVISYGVVFNDSPVYQSGDTIERNYQDYVGTQVHLWATVAAETEDGVVIKAGRLRLTTTSIPPSAVDPGDSIQIYGELQADNRIAVDRFHAKSPTERLYMYGISLVGATLAAVGFLQRWSIDLRAWQFVPRRGE